MHVSIVTTVYIYIYYHRVILGLSGVSIRPTNRESSDQLLAAEDARHWQPWQLEGRNGVPKLAAKVRKNTSGEAKERDVKLGFKRKW